ncbi:MAG: hypothetical protein GEV06_12945 [Luteitalea sp.]|nr:hypothetical protein [Luteitalea sp.]
MRKRRSSREIPLAPPPLARFTRAERHLIRLLGTPRRVQQFLNGLSYNTELNGETQQSFRGVVRARRVHCLEAALFAAVVLEQRGVPPLLMSLESIDKLDHVLFVYRARTGWGSIARSRDPGLHGRRPVFRTARQLALSYVDPYVDKTGRITGYGLLDLRSLGQYDWRFATTNVWKVERALINLPHRAIRSSDRRIDRLRRAYLAFIEACPGQKPVDYAGRDAWTPIPRIFT